MLKNTSKLSILSNIIKMGSKKLILSILVILLAISLIPWSGSGNFFSNTTNDKWVVVGNKYTSATVILREYEQFVQKNYMYLQSNPMALGQYLNSLIGQYVSVLLFSNEASQINVVVNEKFLLNLIAKIPSFQGSNGFDKEKFDAQINQIFGSEKSFIDTISNNILKDQLLESMYPFVKEPNYISYLDYLAITQEREIKYIEITSKMVENNIGKPENKDLEAIRDANISQFENPESRNFLYYTIDTQNIYKSIKILDTQLQEYYNKNLSNYMENEKKDLTQIIFTTLEEANKAYARLVNTDIKKAPKDLNLINVGLVEFDDLPEELSKEVFKSKEKIFSKPIQTQIGWHIIYVNKTYPPSPLSFDKVKAEIQKELLERQKNEILNNVRNEVINHLNQNDKSSPTTSQKSNLWKYTELNNVLLNSKTLPNDVLKTAFNLSENSATQILEDQQDNFYAIKMLKITPKTLKNFDTIKPELIKMWTTKRINEETIKLATEINLEIAKSGINKIKNYNVKTIKVKQTDPNYPFTDKSLELLFSSNKSVPMQGSLKNGNIIVSVVTNIMNPTIKFDMKNKDLIEFNDFSSKSYVQSFIEAYARILQNKYKVSVNEKAILDTLAPKEVQE